MICMGLGPAVIYHKDMTLTTKQCSNIRDLEELAGHAANIFWSEERNKVNIHLHKFRNYWFAFEKSAYFIRNIFGDRDLCVLRCQVVPFPMVGIFIPDSELPRLYSTFDLSKASRNFRSFVTDCPLTGYAAWHRNTIKRLLSDLK